MNTSILFTTFLFFHHQILAIYALTCPTFQEIAVRLPNGQKFALLLPKSFVETKIAIFFYGTNLSLLFIKIEHIQTVWVNFTIFLSRSCTVLLYTKISLKLFLPKLIPYFRDFSQ